MIKRWKDKSTILGVLFMMERLAPVGKCYSGLIGADVPPACQRVFLATPGALARIEENRHLQRTLKEFNSPEVLKAHIFYFIGLAPQVFEGREHWSIGIYLPQERAAFEEAKEMLASSRPGIHRRIFFRMIGIEVSPAMDSLTANEYNTMLALLWESDSTLENIIAIGFRSSGFHSLRKGNNSQKRWTFSLRQLPNDPEYSVIDRESFKSRFITPEMLEENNQQNLDHSTNSVV